MDTDKPWVLSLDLRRWPVSRPTGIVLFVVVEARKLSAVFVCVELGAAIRGNAHNPAR